MNSKRLKKTIGLLTNNYFSKATTDKEIIQGKADLLLKSASILVSQLENELNAKFEIIDDELIVTVGDINIYAETEEDLFIINEVYSELVYGFFSGDNYLLIDIGLNIGISSLYFNSIPQIKKIYAFEPVYATYNKCLRNLKLNNNTSILTHNFGLGNEDKKEYFTYSETFKGSIGKNELSTYKKNASTNLETVEVQIKEASVIIDKIIQSNPGLKVFVKMDCEGAETEIISNLVSKGIINSIDLLILEWHDISFLTDLSFFKDFNCFYHKNSPTTGMLYASRKTAET